MKEEKEKSLYDFIAELLNQDNVTGATLIMPDCPVMQFIKLDRQKKEGKREPWQTNAEKA